MFRRWQTPHNWYETRLMLTPDEGNPSGGNNGNGNEPVAVPAASAITPTAKGTVADLIKRYDGDTVKIFEDANVWRNENFTYRERHRQDGLRITALEASQAPQGSRILTADEAKSYDAYVALGKQPAELSTIVTERDDLAGKVRKSERDNTLRTVAEVAGYNLPALRLVGADAEYEVRDVTDAEGKKSKAAFITDGETFRPLSEYATTNENWQAIAPALMASANPNGTSGGVATVPPVVAQTYPAQRGTQSQGAKDPLADYIKARNERATKAENPLEHQIVR